MINIISRQEEKLILYQVNYFLLEVHVRIEYQELIKFNLKIID